MTVCVFGLWHLGCVTAACVAEHFQVIGLDPNPATIANLRAGKPPIMEPGLPELIQSGIAREMLRFTDNQQEAVQAAYIVWVAFDTPVDECDVADFGYVEAQVIDI